MPRLLELFSGTGSVGRAFQRAGWEVVSVDLCPQFNPTHCVDILEWECPYPAGHFDAVHASPPCEQYSLARTTAKTPRNLGLADARVAKALVLIELLRPRWWFCENPASGLLKTRPLMQGLPYVDVCYCAYGFPYKKRTRIWTNTGLEARPCPGPGKCLQMQGKRHLRSAQRGPSGGRKEDRFRLEDLYRMPEGLCDAMVAACA
jgi:site-specific DNA-cytosine methylase